jgi:hypothetical protein
LSYSVAVLPEARRHLSRLEQKHLLAVLEFIYGGLGSKSIPGGATAET